MQIQKWTHIEDKKKQANAIFEGVHQKLLQDIESQVYLFLFNSGTVFYNSLMVGLN